VKLVSSGVGDSGLGLYRGVCAVTGASGYVGSRIANHLAGAGWGVRALCRSDPPLDEGQVTHVHFDLATGPTPEMLAGADALVHAGYSFDETRWSDIARVNIEGSRRLFAAAKDAEVERVIYVSTTAAFPGARSKYGRAKLESERLALELGATVVRCGLVWGQDAGAMFGALRGAVARLPIVPLAAPADLEIALVCDDDLVVFIERLLDVWPEASERLFVAAASRSLTLAELLGSLSGDARAKRRFVPIPWMLAWLGLRSLESLGVTPPFRSDSLLSLVRCDDDPLVRATGRAERYGVSFRAYTGT
jgi:nucleoside-diphosphate-sugar epimerase